MKGILLFGKKVRLFREWSKLIGFSGAVRLFLPVYSLLSFFAFLITLITALVFMQGCQGLIITEESKGELKLSFSNENFTKTVVREFPDSNSFILSIKSTSGSVVYEGTYGARPATLTLKSGSYDVNITSRIFTIPEFDAPCYSDSKTVVVETDKVCLLSFTCRQSNAGIRISFTPDFTNRFKGYKPELADTKGTLEYPYTETRFAYLNPGSVSLRLKEILPYGSPNTPEIISISNREIKAMDMLTIKLHANPSDPSLSKTGIIIDTIANWMYEYIEIGGGGDGSSKDKAFTVNQLAENIGKTGVWVTGYIVGGDLSSTEIVFAPPFQKNTNIAIAVNPTVNERAKCVSVTLPEGAIRDLLNLVANPSNLGRKVYLKGTIDDSYFGLIGINPLSSAEF